MNEYQQPNQQAPQQVAPQASESSGKAVAALICSLAGFFLCPIIMHVVGIVLGHMALSDIRGSQGRLTGDGMAKGGIIAGWIGIGLWLLGLCIYVFFFVIMFSAWHGKI